MQHILSDELVTAKKHYLCDASRQWLQSGYVTADCDTDDQMKSVLAAEADNWRILPGQKYRKCKGVNDGRFCTYRARIDMDALAIFGQRSPPWKRPVKTRGGAIDIGQPHGLYFG